MEQLSNRFLRYPDPPEVLQYPGVPAVVGGLGEMVDPVAHLAFPDEVSPALLELSDVVHSGDLLVVTDNNNRYSSSQSLVSPES